MAYAYIYIFLDCLVLSSSTPFLNILNLNKSGSMDVLIMSLNSKPCRLPLGRWQLLDLLSPMKITVVISDCFIQLKVKIEWVSYYLSLWYVFRWTNQHSKNVNVSSCEDHQKYCQRLITHGMLIKIQRKTITVQIPVVEIHNIKIDTKELQVNIIIT